MSIPMRHASFERVLLDMNTQCDFLLPKGALPVANRAEVLPNIRRIMNWGRVGRFPVLSSLESHRIGESNNGLPPYCIDCSKGQKKLPFTLMPRRILLQGDNTLDLPHDPFRRYQQVIFTKRDCDFLSNPKADRLINALRIGCIVVFGVLAEQCIKMTVLGLLARRRRIIVVRDACGYWYAGEGELAFRQMEAKGALLASTDELLSGEAAAKLAQTARPVFTEDDEPAESVGKGNGRGLQRDGSYTDGSPYTGGNGRRRGKPRPDNVGPVDIPRRNVRSHFGGRAGHGLD